MRVTACQGDTVDALCWRYYGKTEGMTERVYNANPGLCEKGAVLAAGQQVELPDEMPQARRETVQLWT